ncbi:MAG: TIGR01777 family oxidoreductase [Planctomycetota bacterium]
MRTLITGATGFVGRELLRRLPLCRVLTRSPERARAAFGQEADIRQWDWRAGRPPPETFDDIEAVVHLAGEPIADRRWTPALKETIRASRVESTRHLVEAMVKHSSPPRTLVCASGIGFYGDRGDELLDEDTSAGQSFLAQVCVEWEAAALRAGEHGVRVVCLRSGVVLDPSGGALKRMMLPFRLGVGGVLGPGDQWFPWIAREDLVRIVECCLASPTIAGPVNAVAPELIQNRTFVRELGRALHRPALVWTPAPLLRIALGEFANELLASQRAVPKRLTAHGFKFERPALASTLTELLAHNKGRPG